MFISNIWPNSAPVQDIRCRNLSDLDYDLQGHSRSNVMVSLGSPYIVSTIYMVTTCLSLSFSLSMGTMVHFKFSKKNR